MNTYPTTPMAYVQIPLAEIKENDWDLSINRYKEIVYEEVEYDAPTEIIGRINKLSEERIGLLQQLSQNWQ